MLYLQKSWADRIDNPAQTDIATAFAEMETMGEEEGAFWVSSTADEEVVLEVQKDWTLTMVICNEICRTCKCKRRDQAEELFNLLLTKDFDKLKDQFECL